ncbi:MAG: hypothetical protein GY777_29860 [Candidatus Brocadiaceae bacterium]|nr:hypothetical protein [Candidatus Brocadiaceae bacterium]
MKEKRKDVPAFARYLLEKYRNELNKPITTFDDISMSTLLRYNFSGNIRKLENIVERAIALSEDGVIYVDYLPDETKLRKYNYTHYELVFGFQDPISPEL